MRVLRSLTFEPPAPPPWAPCLLDRQHDRQTIAPTPFLPLRSACYARSSFFTGASSRMNVFSPYAANRIDARVCPPPGRIHTICPTPYVSCVTNNPAVHSAKGEISDGI